MLSDGIQHAVVATKVTQAPMASTLQSRFVWLTNTDGRQLSNRVAVDEPTQLAAVLAVREQQADRPEGMEAADMETPVGQMLARLHDRCIFDFDETPAARRAARAAEQETEDPEFWERLAREELHQDPRIARYATLSGSAPVLEGIFIDIARMREMVPAMLPDLRLVGEPSDSAEGTRGKAWSSDRKLQVRLFNLFERWSRALSDPRLQWLGTYAPVANFAALCSALVECWREGYLPEQRVVSLVGTLLTSFIREARRDGFLARLEDDERNIASSLLSASDAPSLAAALAYGSLRHARADLMDYLFDWQPALRDGLDWRVFRADEAASDLIESITGSKVAPEAVVERMTWATTFINDSRWSELASDDTGLPVVLTDRPFADDYGATIDIGPGIGLLSDPRVVELVRRALSYRQTSGCIVESGSNRLSVKLGLAPAARVDGRFFESDDRITQPRLDELASSGMPLAVLEWPNELVA